MLLKIQITIAIVVFHVLLLSQENVIGQEHKGPVDALKTTEPKLSSDQWVSDRLALIEASVKDLETYETLADEIEKTWRDKDRASYALLMKYACEPLSSGTFKETRRYELARKYALLALEKPDEIPLVTEMELIGHVITLRIGPGAIKGEQFSQQRKKDVAIRLHAWKRLIESVDPNWDPDEVLWEVNVTPPAETGLPPGIQPEAIENAELRKEYEVKIEKNWDKIEKYEEQSDLRKWLKRYPRRTEKEIIQAYSHPPFNIEELELMLRGHLSDQDLELRIVNTVKKNMREKGWYDPGTQVEGY